MLVQMASLLSAALGLCLGGVQAERHRLVLLCVTAKYTGVRATDRMGGCPADAGPELGSQAQLQKKQARAAKYDPLYSDTGHECLQEEPRQVEAVCRLAGASWL